MSEEALSQHIDPWMADGDAAALPEDGETRALAGTVRLAQAALTAPTPPAEAELASRERILTQLRDSTLSPRVLREHDETPRPATLLGRLWQRTRSFLGKG